MTDLREIITFRSPFSDLKLRSKELLSNNEISAHQVFNFKKSYNQYFESNKYPKIEEAKDFIIPGQWENTFAIIKLKQMILNNAKKQILVKRHFQL